MSSPVVPIRRRVINGGAPLRGFARDQVDTEDSHLSAQAKKILRAAGENHSRLIVDEEGNVVSGDGKKIFVGDDVEIDPTVAAVNSLKDYVTKEMKHVSGALADLRRQRTPMRTVRSRQRIQGQQKPEGVGSPADRLHA